MSIRLAATRYCLAGGSVIALFFRLTHKSFDKKIKIDGGNADHFISAAIVYKQPLLNHDGATWKNNIIHDPLAFIWHLRLKKWIVGPINDL